jgi:transcription termination factor Rho
MAVLRDQRARPPSEGSDITVTETYEQTPAAAPERTARGAGNTNGAAGTDAATTAKRPAAKKGSLSTMLLPELQQLAASMGLATTKMKKSDLVAAIQTARNGASADSPPARRERPARAERPAERPAEQATDADERPSGGSRANAQGQNAGNRDTTRGANRDGANRDGVNRDANRQNRPQNQNRQDGGGNQNNQNQNRQDRQDRQDRQERQDDDDFDGGRRRGRRYRDRRGRNRDRVGGPVGGNSDVEPTVSEDDVLVPVAGILDSVEDKNTWFVRTEGYFASTDDIYVANSYVRRYGLRRGDTVTGAVKQVQGERREKYNPLVRLDTVNGTDPEQSKNRIEFTKMTPLYPQERLRLETEPHILTTRVIDLVMPIGKGQRALIVSPPKAGKTMVLQSIANAIATNNPEVHLMVVLIDERPEEVTDMQRSVKGEVIASTFDRRPQDHITVAELSIERAKRLVEMGHDVVVLLDSITRLGRAYNLGAPASGRILSGGVDSTALYPPKRFLGAARNIENGGSLTILATALVETGSAGDTVIFEEFKGTGNAELKLDRKIADKRVFPAVDVDQSSTRKEEILLSPDELAVTIKLRRVLHALEAQQAIDLLLDRLKKTPTNLEFLMQIAKTTPGQE